MKNIVFIVIIAILLATTIFYWQKSQRLSYRLDLIQQRIEESKKEVKPKYKARVAIVIDDLGYNLNNVEKISKLQAPVTLSILPNLAYSKSIAKVMKDNGLEVILHLPLEPYENTRLEKGTIMTSMTDKEILNNLEKAVSSVPNLKGISNHMGSKATEDRKTMSIIFKRMKKNNLYFLDSLVTNRSICRKLAKKMKIKFASRSVFLDNEQDAEYIKTQIKELAKEALSTGSAIGIGHDRVLTIDVLKEMIPYLKNAGIGIVPISELVE